MKQKLITALYEQGMHESWVDKISDTILPNDEYFPSRSLRETYRRERLEQIRDAINETLNDIIWHSKD